MNATELIAALELTASTRVQQRVAKKLLLENGAPTATDKRAISDGIEETQWVAALKPGNIGVPIYRDETREYLEIAVLHVTLRPGAKTTRLTELIHRAIPYPVVLIATRGIQTDISLAHKRWAQNEAGKVVLDGDLLTAAMTGERPEIERDLLEALPLSKQSRSSLFNLYQSWEDCLIAFQAAQQTGAFTLLGTDARRRARMMALQESIELGQQLVSLRAAAKKASQMARQVELNLQVKKLERKLAQVKDDL